MGYDGMKVAQGQGGSFLMDPDAGGDDGYSEDPGEEIRREHALSVKTLSNGDTGNASYYDAKAFDRVAARFGYVETVRALKTSSPHAKQLDAAYWARRARR